MLTAGTYTLTTTALNVTRGVAIEGETPGAVVIDAGAEFTGIRRAMIINPQSSMEDKVTLTGLNFTGGFVIEDGGALHILGGRVELDRCNIYKNTASGGGGIAVEPGAAVTLRGCSIFSNTGQDGGGVLVRFGHVTLNGCDVRANKAYQGKGGGLFVQNGTVLLEQDTRVSRNNADYDGGGIFVDGGDVSVRDCDVQANHADSFGFEVRGGLRMPTVQLMR